MTDIGKNFIWVSSKYPIIYFCKNFRVGKQIRKIGTGTEFQFCLPQKDVKLGIYNILLDNAYVETGNLKFSQQKGTNQRLYQGTECAS